jgi:hypothetical protein
MSGRIEKSKRATTSERRVLADRINFSGFDVMPCSFCFKHHKACKMASGSARCGECVSRGRSCDGSKVASALSKAIADQKKYEEEETNAKEALKILQT